MVTSIDPLNHFGKQPANKPGVTPSTGKVLLDFNHNRRMLHVYADEYELLSPDSFLLTNNILCECKCNYATTTLIYYDAWHI